MKIFSCLFFLLIFRSAFAQLDSIEENIAIKRHGFIIREGKYIFYNDTKVIDSSTLIFPEKDYFANRFLPCSYIDSVQLALLTRSLKRYGEIPLFSSKDKSLRIIVYKENYTLIIKTNAIDQLDKINYKIGDGIYYLTGKIVKEDNIKINTVEAKKLKRNMKIIFSQDLSKIKPLNNNGEFSINDKLIVEFFDGFCYKLFIINDSFLKEKRYKMFYKTAVFLEGIINRSPS